MAVISDNSNEPSESGLLNTVLPLLHRYLTPLIILAGIVILAGSYVFLLRPKYSSITEELQALIQSKEDDKDMMDRYLIRLRGYQQSFALLDDADKQALEKILPAKYDQEDLFALIDSFTRGQGAELTSMEIGKKLSARSTGPGSGIASVLISMNVSGLNYRGLKSFLAAFEQSMPLMDVINVSYTEGVDSVAFKVLTYYFDSK